MTRAGRKFCIASRPIVKDVDGKLENADGQDEERGESERLKEAVARKPFGPVAILRRELATQDVPEDHKAVEKADDAEAKADPAAVAGFAVEIGREGISSDLVLGLKLRAPRSGD